jgi:hypothetical protein
MNDIVKLICVSVLLLKLAKVCEIGKVNTHVLQKTHIKHNSDIVRLFKFILGVGVEEPIVNALYGLQITD